MSFDRNLFYSYFKSEAINFKFEYFESIDSTNTYLMKKNIGSDKILVLAEYQTKGRGRFEREWLSEKGLNLTFSLGFKPSIDIQNLPKINFATALATAVAVEDICKAEVEIKWPNDLLLSKKKFCGILIETSVDFNELNKIIIGIGLNVNQEIFPDEIKDRTTSLKSEFKHFFEREIILARILENLDKFISRLPMNFDNIFSEWKKRCKLIGDNIALTNEVQTFKGIFHDVNEDGSMILKCQNQFLTFNAGDVSIMKENL